MPPYIVRDDILKVEVFKENSKSIILNLIYQPLHADPKKIENHFKNILLKWEINNKELVSVEFLNINVHGFNERKMIRSFVNLIFRHGLIPTIKKLTHITASIYQIFSNKCRTQNR